MTYTFSVPTMSCGHCKARIEKALAAAGYATGVAVDLGAKTVSVEADSAAAVATIIADAGYPAAPL